MIEIVSSSSGCGDACYLLHIGALGCMCLYVDDGAVIWNTQAMSMSRNAHFVEWSSFKAYHVARVLYFLTYNLLLGIM